MLIGLFVTACTALQLSLSVDHFGFEKTKYSVKYPEQLPNLSIQKNEKLQFRAELDIVPRQIVLSVDSVTIPFKASGSSFLATIDPDSVPATGSYDIKMYIANDDEKLEYALGSIQITNSKSNVDVGYVVKPEIIYQFKPQEKIANPLISNIFTILTLSPWWINLGINLKNMTSSTTNTIFSGLFLVALGLSLLLFHAFWLKLNLFQYFTYAIPFWIITAFFGRLALIQRSLLRK